MFVDDSGRRARWIGRLLAVVALLSIGYAGLVIAGLMGASVVGDIGVPHQRKVAKSVADAGREQQTSTNQPSLVAPQPPTPANGVQPTQTTTATAPTTPATAAPAPVASPTLPTTPTTAAHGQRPTSPPGQGRRP